MEAVSWRKSLFSNPSGNCVEVGNYRKSARSNPSGECVEVGNSDDIVAVRDTMNREGFTLSLPASAWKKFIATL